jgi:hypothetical protein
LKAVLRKNTVSIHLTYPKRGILQLIAQKQPASKRRECVMKFEMFEPSSTKNGVEI